MRVKIKDGTAREDGPSLCLSCRLATVVRGPRLRDEIIECAALARHGRRITFPVTFCNSYVNANHPSLGEMEETAWVLRSDPRRGQMGFVKASRLKPTERYVLSED